MSEFTFVHGLPLRAAHPYMDDMRLFLPVVALLLAVPALAQPNQPRDPASKDGLFTICAFQNFDQCDLLSEQSIQKFKFSAAEKRTLEELRRHAEAPLIKLTDLEKSFGKPAAVRPNKNRPDERTIAWFQKAPSGGKSKCPECGVYLYVTGDLVTAINFMVDGKFSLSWNRAESPKTPQ